VPRGAIKTVNLQRHLAERFRQRAETLKALSRINRQKINRILNINLKITGLQLIYTYELYFIQIIKEGESNMDPTGLDREKFWDAEAFTIITDRTKPAMKWAASELKNRGKKVYLVDLSGKPDPNSLTDVTSLPSGIANAVIGITKSDPGDLIPLLREKGASKIWLHWRTETEKALEACQKLKLECITGYCPMMYLGSGLSIHGVHRTIAKVTGKY
jgi:hypothetical protein